MTDKQRMYAYLGGGALLLFLIYRHFAGASASSAGGTIAPSADTSGGAQYAGLAGQEQSDIAGLQAQEQSDVQTLMSTLGQNAATEQSDYQTVTGNEQASQTAIQGLITSLAGSVLGLGQSVAQLTAARNVPAAASGATQTNRPPTGGGGSGPLNPASASPLQQVQWLLATGYHKVSGTTQQGGLAQTGTYVNGGNRYFVYGTQQTGLHVRKAA